MPSFWKRIGLAAALTAQVSASPILTFAQQYPAPGNHCTTTQPCAPSTGRAHVGSPGMTSPTPEPPPWQTPGTLTPPPMATDPSTVPPPPMATDPSTPSQDPNAQPMDPMIQPPAAEPDFTPPTDTALSFNQPQLGIGSPDQVFGPPNMMGDLLRAYRGVTFGYLQAGDNAVVTTGGAVNFRNSKVAENNSAIPRDRVSMRYNYFKNAIQVQGLDSSPTLGDPFTVAGRRFQFNEVQPASRDYDVHLYTLGLEKTLLDGMASIEVRVPFARTLDSSLDLVSGIPIDVAPGVVPAVQPTPGQTLGQSDTEIQDMNLILKAIIAQDPGRRWTVSAGLGITIPTGEDVDVRTVDYSNNLVVTGNDGRRINGADFFQILSIDPEERFDSRRVRLDPILGPVFLFGDNQFAFDQRTRRFQIENETWGIAPFLAAAMQPTDRTFVNGFFQIDVPLNSSDWRYQETDVDLELQAQGLPAVQFDRTASGTIQDQVLLNLDLGAGYWLYQNPNGRLLKGVAALAELHYTTTLEDADIVVVPETRVRTTSGGFDPNTGITLVTEPLGPPRLGNIANRVDFLNLTMGSTFLIGNHATLAAGYVVPLRDDLDRTFDGELNVQLNIYR